jgi:hypothetical protein
MSMDWNAQYGWNTIHSEFQKLLKECRQYSKALCGKAKELA